MPKSELKSSVPSINQVLLVGRLSGEPVVRVLPSGDEVTTWRLVVEREGRRPQGTDRRAPSIDTIDCVAHTRGVRRLAGAWSPGDMLEVRGALRRRFWRSNAGPASRCEVEASEVRRRARADRE